MKESPLYKTMSVFFKSIFPYKVQKISINAGLTCPNRDGSKGTGGCTYCNNQAFNPGYCFINKSISQQINEGKRFFYRKDSKVKYIAYFQSFTGTYGPISKLKEMYEEALAVSDVEGIIIGTRPDCMNEELLNYFSALSKHKFVGIEYGIESINDKTLLFINRGHTYADTINAIKASADCGICVGGHVMLGLPGESRSDILNQAYEISKLPLKTLKIHQLQILKGTVMAKQYALSPETFNIFTSDKYIDLLIDYLELLPPDIALDRFVSLSPKDMLIAPRWNMKSDVFMKYLIEKMVERGSYQGKKYKRC